MACTSSAVAAVVSTWTTTSTVHTCLCHLPPTRRAYTCLTVYAASAVPQCAHCSAPCTASPLSLACGQADNDPYSWVLRILDMALGSCDPWCTAVVLHQALQALLAQTAPVAYACVDSNGEPLTDTTHCTGATEDEQYLEQATTTLFYLAQRPHRQHPSAGFGTTAGPCYSRLALAPFALPPQTVRLLVTGCNANATSVLSAGECGTDLRTAKTDSLRALYRLRQRLAALLKRLDLATQLHQLDANAFAYALAATQDDQRWHDVPTTPANAWGAPRGNDTPDADANREAERQRLVAGQQGLAEQAAQWTQLRTWYTTALARVDALCDGTTSTLAYTGSHTTTTTSTDGSLCNTSATHEWSSTASLTTTTPTTAATFAATLNAVESLLTQASAYADQRALAQSWATTSPQTSVATPALDTQLTSVAKQQVQLETNRAMRTAVEAFVQRVYGTTVPTAAAPPRGDALGYREQVRMLRRVVGLAEGGRWV